MEEQYTEHYSGIGPRWVPDCPICHQPAKLGYACGDYFIYCSPNCISPMCDHPDQLTTIVEWRDWVLSTAPDWSPRWINTLRARFSAWIELTRRRRANRKEWKSRVRRAYNSWRKF